MAESPWETLVRELDTKARANPGAHRRKVLALALLGYLFILGFIGVLLGIAVAVVLAVVYGHAVIVLKLLVFIGGLVWVIVRALHVSFEPPSGVEIIERDAPELFRMLGEVRAAVGAPRVQRVLLDADPNAGIVQIPRASGLLGSRNYLLLGLPYLAALTPDELRAVVAHELGHLSRRHGRFGSFVYRVRATWFQLLEAFEERRSVWTGLIRAFFEWYVPYFNAYALPVARVHEFEADDAAAQVAGREAAAAGLAAGLLAARWVERAYWPGVFRTAELSQAPPVALVPLVERIGEARSYGDVEGAFHDLLAEDTDVTSSHPSLRERLQHLGIDPDVALAAATHPERRTALEVLGASADRLASAVDAYWRARVASDWREVHRQAVESRRRLRELEAAEVRSPEEELERAGLVEGLEGEDAALPLYRAVVGGQEEAFAFFAIGRILLERGDEEGLSWLDKAIAADLQTEISGSALAAAYLESRGRDDEAERYRSREVTAYEAFAERVILSASDRLEASGLPEPVLSDVVAKVQGRLEIEEAYVLRKRLEHRDEERPLYVLAYVPKRAYRDDDERREALGEWLSTEIELPGELLVIPIVPDSPMDRHVRAVEAGLIYSRR